MSPFTGHLGTDQNEHSPSGTLKELNGCGGKNKTWHYVVLCLFSHFCTGYLLLWQMSWKWCSLVIISWPWGWGSGLVKIQWVTNIHVERMWCVNFSHSALSPCTSHSALAPSETPWACLSPELGVCTSVEKGTGFFCKVSTLSMLEAMRNGQFVLRVHYALTCSSLSSFFSASGPSFLSDSWPVAT